MRDLQELKTYAEGVGCQSDVIEWIEKRVKDQPLGEVEHILDYLASDKRPRRLNRATYNQMKSNATKWTASLAKKGNHLDDADGVETVLDFGDGFRFVKLVSKEAYEREGYLMRHCVASYYGRDVTIYSLRDNQNQPHCTIEQDVQIKGKGNGDIHPRYIDYVVKFLEWTGMEVRDSEMEHLGYERVVFGEWVESVEGGLYREKYKRKGAKVTYSDAVIVFTDLEEAVSYRGDKVVLLDGDADFRNSQITDLGQLQSIGGYADFRNSKITDLGQLQSIGGDADFEGSHITSLGQLKSIGRFADFRYSQVTDLGQLQSTGGSAYFRNSQVTSLDQLQSIGGYADFEGSHITSLGQLQSIGGWANFRDSHITDWGNVEIKGEVYK